MSDTEMTMPKRMLHTVAEVIDALGGPTAVGTEFNIGQSAVSNWSLRGEIPRGWHLIIYLRLKSLGFDVHPSVFGLDSLDNLNGKRRPPKGKGNPSVRVAHA